MYPNAPWKSVDQMWCRFWSAASPRRIGDLRLGRGRYAIACAHHGGLFIDGVLFRLEEDRFWYVQPDGALETWLLAHAEGFDVTVSDPENPRVLQIQGLTSFPILQDLTEGAITEKMGYFHSGFFTVAGQEVYVSRTGWTGEIGCEIYTQANTNADVLWKRVLSAGAPHGMRFGSVASMGIRRIEAGILESGSDSRPNNQPMGGRPRCLRRSGRSGLHRPRGAPDRAPRPQTLRSNLPGSAAAA